MTVKSLASELSLWSRIEAAVATRLSARRAKKLLRQLADIPVQRSRAVRRLGSYVSQSGRPVCIRLQFAQEPETLSETFLHEVAHACDHLSQPFGWRPSQAHGPKWQKWAGVLGITPSASGRSAELDKLYAERLKVVAVCQRCGAELRRLRRLNPQRNYVHRTCGGHLTLF